MNEFQVSCRLVGSKLRRVLPLSKLQKRRLHLANKILLFYVMKCFFFFFFVVRRSRYLSLAPGTSRHKIGYVI